MASRLAGQQLLIDEIRDQPLEFPGVRRPQPLVLVQFFQPFDLALADPHRLDGFGAGLVAVQPGIGGKQDRSRDCEVKQWFP